MEFIRDLMPITRRAINLSSVIFFLVGCVGVFQFLLANKGWPQDIAEWVIAQDLTALVFLVFTMLVLLALSTFLTGIAILVLTVPIFFPVANALGIDPIHLGILVALAVECGAIIPPVGLNLFAVSGTTGVPLIRVIKGSSPFLFTDVCVLVLVLFFPILALWLPSKLVVSVF